jgi:hypothetical protein
VQASDDVTDPIENQPAWLLRKLAGVESDLVAEPQQLAAVRAFLDAYRAAGLIAGHQALPLDVECPSCDRCWRGVPVAAHPSPVDAAMSVPWIGAGYRRGGVVAVAINLNKYGGLGAQWWVRHEDNKRLRAGRRPVFGYRAGTYLALLHAGAGGGTLDPEPDPAAVADAWDRTAFVEAVKCSPVAGVGEPTGAMWEHCPPRYLRRDLQLLAPGVVVVIGRRPAQALEAVLGIRWADSPTPALRRGVGRLDGRTLDVIACNHPSRGHWRASTPALAASLARDPVAHG